MTIYQELLSVPTTGRGSVSVHRRVEDVIKRSGLEQGLCTVFVQHTSASLIIQENADPAVQRDLQSWLDDLAPADRPWEHADEGPDDMPAHAKSVITKTSESIPFSAGRLLTGTWQGLYLLEHRAQAHTRRLVVHLMGE
ncbi:MAG: secondary thiamine-phosphate synthase enzyme YjbQ [Polyangiaceae bacterium]|nr:secondary thiamine-phosphate synthase enzyme YjbQ [Polyangiaceae bacterium]